MKLIGVDLGGTNIRAGLVSNGKITSFVSDKINAKGSQKEVLNQIIKVIDKVYTRDVHGIGIGVPSIVDVKNGIVYETTNIPSWKNVKVKKILESKYKIPVFVNNDANCFALGERYFGKGKKYKNIVGLIIGTGFGAGIIINDKLHAGNNCGAGEFGEVIYKDNNLEYYCSGRYFSREYGLSGEEAFAKAQKKDKKAIKAFESFGWNLGKALSVVLHSVDPEIIILGGSVSKAYKFFEKSMRASLKESSYARSYSRLKIEVSTRENIAILGAASLCYDAKK